MSKRHKFEALSWKARWNLELALSGLEGIFSTNIRTRDKIDGNQLVFLKHRGLDGKTVEHCGVLI
jgi:hypothetical protein